jgi:hypothetical protein
MKNVNIDEKLSKLIGLGLPSHYALDIKHVGTSNIVANHRLSTIIENTINNNSFGFVIYCKNCSSTKEEYFFVKKGERNENLQKNS